MRKIGEEVQIINGVYRGRVGIIKKIDYILFRYTVDIDGQFVEIKDPECTATKNLDKEIFYGQTEFYQI